MKRHARVSGKALIRDYLMAYRIRQLPTVQSKAEIWYHGASDIKTWIEGHLEQFELGIIDAVERGVEVRRLFVFDKPLVEKNIGIHSKGTEGRSEDAKIAGADEKLATGEVGTRAGAAKDRTRYILSHHAEIMKSSGNYKWRAILRAALPETIRYTVPFALFSDGDVDVEVAQGDDYFHFGAVRVQMMQLQEGFNSAWKSVEDVQSIRKVLVPAESFRPGDTSETSWVDKLINLMRSSETPNDHQHPYPDDHKDRRNEIGE